MLSVDEMLVSWAIGANKSRTSLGKQLNMSALYLGFPN